MQNQWVLVLFVIVVLLLLAALSFTIVGLVKEVQKRLSDNVNIRVYSAVLGAIALAIFLLMIMVFVARPRSTPTVSDNSYVQTPPVLKTTFAPSTDPIPVEQSPMMFSQTIPAV